MSSSALPPRTDPLPPSTVDQRDSPHNFLILALYQIVTRTGWIFKTESIVMPAVLDSIAGAGWIRGWLPLLNRFGNSIPPLVLADQVRGTPRKRRVLLLSTASMALFLLLLAACFRQPAIRTAAWMPWAFLLIYCGFFMSCGISQLSFNTLQGKLVPATSRGRLLLVSNLVGAVTAVSCAFLLLPQWLQGQPPRFDLIFAFSGALFLVSALCSLALNEPADQPRRARSLLRHLFSDTWQIWNRDSNFRRLSVVGALFSCSIMLFPHYQHLALQGMQLDVTNLMWWVVVQNIATGLFSVPVGRLADRQGNRRVLLIALPGSISAPLSALLLWSMPELGGRLFFLVFVFVGLTPVILRSIQNFTLELCANEDHPRYLGALGITISAPMLASPLVGALIDWVGFVAVFLAVAVLVLLGWLLAFGLAEPREHVSVGFWSPGD